jgi:hypothetical protein
MGFFDEFKDVGGGSWVGAEEKAEMIASETVITVSDVIYDPTNKYGPRYVVKFVLDGEDRSIGFGAESVESRDRMLAALSDYLDANEGETVDLVMEKIDRSVVLREA